MLPMEQDIEGLTYLDVIETIGTVIFFGMPTLGLIYLGAVKLGLLK